MNDIFKDIEPMVHKSGIKVPYSWWAGDTASELFRSLRDEEKIIGNKRKKFLSALVNINMLQAEQLAKGSNIAFDDPEDLLENEKFLGIVDQHVAKVNTNLARFETIKKYRIVKDEFTQETGELTASLKMKRNVINEKHKKLIDTMYEE